MSNTNQVLMAEKLPYWKTSRKSSTKWLDESKALLA